MWKKFELTNYITSPRIGVITDEQVYQVVKSHSRFVDRLNPRKWVEMTLMSQTILMGIIDGVSANDPKWKFYGKHKF